MLNEDELGEALRGSMGELVRDIEPSPHLQNEVAGIGQSRNRRRRRVALPRAVAAAALATAATLTAIVIALTGSAAPSYAVTIGPGHAVTVTIYDLAGVSGANKRLHQLGVRAVVVPMTAGCTTQISLTHMGIPERPAPTIRLIPQEIAHGTTVVLAAQKIGPNMIDMAIGKVSGQPPKCVAPGTTGPGIKGTRTP